MEELSKGRNKKVYKNAAASFIIQEQPLCFLSQSRCSF
jgi:hypothetical protein